MSGSGSDMVARRLTPRAHSKPYPPVPSLSLLARVPLQGGSSAVKKKKP